MLRWAGVVISVRILLTLPSLSFRHCFSIFPRGPFFSGVVRGEITLLLSRDIQEWPVTALPTPVTPAKSQNHTCKCMWHLPMPHPAGLHVLMGQPIASRRYRSMRITDRAGIKVRYHPWTNTWSLHPFGQPHEVLVPRITSPWIWHLRIDCPCTRYFEAYSAYRCRHWPSLMRTASTDKPIFPEIGILWRKRRACDLRIPTPHGGSPAFRLAWPIVATDFPDL